MSAPDRMITETGTEDLVEHFSSKYKLTPISVDEARPQEAVYKKRMQVVLAHQREELYRDMGDTQFEFESINFSVPLIHNEEVPHFAQLSTSTRSLSWSIDDYSVTADAITAEFDVPEPPKANNVGSKSFERSLWPRQASAARPFTQVRPSRRKEMTSAIGQATPVVCKHWG
jgi:hypothetical protein